jgi:hypothetical protein
MTDIKKDFEIKEFELLRKEIEYRTTNQWTTERDVVLATIAIYWSRSKEVHYDQLPINLQPIVWLFWLAPIFVFLAGAARWLDDRRVIDRIGEYILEREEIIDSESVYWQKKRLSHPKSEQWPWLLRKISWIALFFIITIVSGYVVLGHFLAGFCK